MKDRIHYHRSYKRLGRVRRPSLYAFLLLVALLDAAIARWHAPLLDAFVARVGELASRAGVATSVTHWEFLPVWIRSMPVLDAAGAFPSRRLALIAFVVTVLVVLVLPKLRFVPKVLRVYVVFLALLEVVSSAFFVLVPQSFPYDVLDFSLLYMGTQFGTWLLMPVVMGVALAPLQTPVLERFGVVLATTAYAAVFGAVRYASFLFLLRGLTVLHMAALFFALGPLIDFVYLVSIYSVYVNVVALRLRDRPETWRWSF